jgi:hypothetical protein
MCSSIVVVVLLLDKQEISSVRKVGAACGMKGVPPGLRWALTGFARKLVKIQDLLKVVFRKDEHFDLKSKLLLSEGKSPRLHCWGSDDQDVPSTTSTSTTSTTVVTAKERKSNL